MEIRVVVAYHSGGGHTARQAHSVAEGASAVANARVDLVSLAELSKTSWELLNASDAIILGSPTYMSGASAVFRRFAEATSSIWSDDLRWRNKIAAGFTNSGCMSGDKLQTLIEMALFAAQHGMIWVGQASFGGWNTTTGSVSDLNRLGSWLGAMAQSNNDEPATTAPPPADLRTAAALGRRVAEVAQIYRTGTLALGAQAPALAPPHAG